MSEKDEIKLWRDLPDAIDFNDGKWTWGRGGRPLTEWQYFIAYTYDDLHQDVYILPGYLGEMLRRQEESGAEKAKTTIRHALGA